MSKQRKRPVTSSDVARLAGVSPASVTRVFNPDWDMNVRPAIKAKVLAAAKELNYTPNAFARMLAGNHTNLIAIVLGPATGYYYSQVLLQFIYKLQSHGQQVLPFATDANTPLPKLIHRIEQYRVDAIIVTSAAHITCDTPLESSIPILMFEQENGGPARHSVCSDSYAGGQMVADMLIDNGHQRIAFISGNGLSETKDFNRDYGFISQMHSRGMKIWRTEIGKYAHYDSGCAATRQLMMGPVYPDAIFCADDVSAMAAIDVLRQEYHLSIPDEISIVGFHDIREAAFPAYSLTTIQSPTAHMVDAAIEFIDQLREGHSDQPYQKLFPMTPVIRQSMRITDPKYEAMRASSVNNPMIQALLSAK